MKYPPRYKSLKVNELNNGVFSIKPIRYSDKESIRKWRNAQINVLRQEQKLTKEKQKDYFNNVISKLFAQIKPNQLLFSYFKNDILVGYGGLVHIDYLNFNAEVSFLLDTDFIGEETYTEFFTPFLQLIIQIAEQLKLAKIYTYGYNIYPYRFKALIETKFELEAELKNQKEIQGELYDVKIYSFFLI